jgi:hypothetical protein
VSKPAILNDSTLAAKGGDLEKLKFAAVKMMAVVEQFQDEASRANTNACKAAVLAGIALLRVKASLPHGQFGKWIKGIGAGEGANSHRGANLGYRQANYYMSLAKVFLSRARVQLPALLALPGDQIPLEIDTGHPSHDLFSKLEKFVGDSSLNALLDEHDIKRGKNIDPESNKRIHHPIKKTKAELDAMRLAVAHTQAISCFSEFSELGDKWMSLTDPELKTALEFVEKFAKRARKWLATPPPARARYDAPETLDEKAGLITATADTTTAEDGGE